MSAGTADRWESYGDMLKALRRKARLKQSDLAQICGRSTSEVARWEQGKALPSLEVLAALRDALGVAYSDLIPNHEKIG